jgi:hypothetical protein
VTDHLSLAARLILIPIDVAILLWMWAYIRQPPLE